MNCTRCGAPHTIGERFCRQCGARLGLIPTLRATVHRAWTSGFGVVLLMLTVIAVSVSILTPPAPGGPSAASPTPTPTAVIAAPDATPTPGVEIRD